MYFLKGYGYVRTIYQPAFRAYEYNVKGVAFLSMGPGWAYSFTYLKELLVTTYCHQYLPQSADCVVDIGSGLGEEVVIFALLVGEKGSVHALEANPSTYAGLKHICQQNKFNWVIPHHAAIYNQDGWVTIEDDEENYLTNTITVEDAQKSGLSVNSKTLDSFVRENNISKIDFLKSNIEGAEQFLIQGMMNSIGILRNVCISCHDFRHVFHNHGEFYMTKQKVIAFLEEHGFEIIIRNTGNRVVDDYIYGKNTRIK